jgi:hypothetical protein
VAEEDDEEDDGEEDEEDEEEVADGEEEDEEEDIIIELSAWNTSAATAWALESTAMFTFPILMSPDVVRERVLLVMFVVLLIVTVADWLSFLGRPG